MPYIILKSMCYWTWCYCIQYYMSEVSESICRFSYFDVFNSFFQMLLVPCLFRQLQLFRCLQDSYEPHQAQGHSSLHLLAIISAAALHRPPPLHPTQPTPQLVSPRSVPASLSLYPPPPGLPLQVISQRMRLSSSDYCREDKEHIIHSVADSALASFVVIHCALRR